MTTPNPKKKLSDLIRNRQHIHTRDIRLETFPHENGQVIVHGELTDRRHVSIINLIGQKKDPGIIHHMTATLLIAPHPLRIIEAQGQMLTIPMDPCRNTLDRIPLLEGLEVKPGFSRQINEIMGGVRGCTHLTTLVRTMGLEIIHGWLTDRQHRQKGAPPVSDMPKETAYLINSCRLWKKDGPKIKELQSIIDQHTSPD